MKNMFVTKDIEKRKNQEGEVKKILDMKGTYMAESTVLSHKNKSD